MENSNFISNFLDNNTLPENTQIESLFPGLSVEEEDGIPNSFISEKKENQQRSIRLLFNKSDIKKERSIRVSLLSSERSIYVRSKIFNFPDDLIKIVPDLIRFVNEGLGNCRTVQNWGRAALLEKPKE